MNWLLCWTEYQQANVVNRDSAIYDVAERGEITRNRAPILDPARYNAIDCPHIQASLLLQAPFGLRAEEAMAFQPQATIRGDHITL